MQVFETMRRVECGPFVVRLWISGWDAQAADELVTQATAMAGQCADTQEAASKIGGLPRINAVEVVEAETLAGHLLYPSWP